MSEKEDKSIDLLGIKPIGEAINTLSKGTIEGAAAFLSRICLPASEEFGLLLKDKVSNWRLNNLVKIAEKAEKKLKGTQEMEGIHAHPRIASLTLEHGSWAEVDEVQEMWAGLLASSCTKDGKDDSNLIFINLLSQLTTLQAKILNYACEKAEKKVSPFWGFVYAEQLNISPMELSFITLIDDMYRLDRELDHLNALGLIIGGFDLDEDRSDEDNRDSGNTIAAPEQRLRYREEELKILMPDLDASQATITPSPLGINLYVRSQGSLLSPAKFFGLSE